MPTSNFQPIRLLDPTCSYKFKYLMINSADPDQLASSEANWSGSTWFATDLDLHGLQRQGIFGFSITRVKHCKYIGISALSFKAGGKTLIVAPASVAQLDAPSDWRPGGRRFNPRRGRQHSFVVIDHEIFSTVILSLPLIQEGQLSVSGERMCTITG